MSRRLALSEYGPPVDLASAAAEFGLSADSLAVHLLQTSRRLSRALSIQPPIRITDGSIVAEDVAGLVRVAPDLFIEIAPKFLDLSDDRWRQDFFLVAMISRFGRLFPQELLPGQLDRNQNLADLLARAVVSIYDRNERRPLRLYRRRAWVGFDVTGELDAESVVYPMDEGYRQSGLRFDRENPYNRLIAEAAQRLVSEVRDGDVRRQLTERSLRLVPQRDRARLPSKRVPARHRPWQELVDLSAAILSGFGIGYADTAQAEVLPGYVVRTAEAWEAMTLFLVRTALPRRRVERVSFNLGEREVLTAQGLQRTDAISTTPDVSIFSADGEAYLVDAKYKSPRGRLSIAAADVYESLAFMESSQAPGIVLVYPADESSMPRYHESRRVAVFERVTVSDRVITGVAVNIGGISAAGGVRKIAAELAETLQPILDAGLVLASPK